MIQVIPQVIEETQFETFKIDEDATGFTDDQIHGAQRLIDIGFRRFWDKRGGEPKEKGWERFKERIYRARLHSEFDV